MVKQRSATKKHECDYKFCQFCFGYHKRDQPCFIQPLAPSDDDKECRFVAFDFESSQNKKTPDGKHQHQVRLTSCSVIHLFAIGQLCMRPGFLHKVHSRR